MSDILISPNDFAAKNIVAINVEVSGFDLVVTTANGDKYIVNDGLSSALMGDLVIKREGAPDLNVDEVLKLTQSNFSGIESEYFSNALKSYGEDINQDSNSEIGNSDQGSEDPVSQIIFEEESESQEQINEINDQLAGAMAAKGLTDKISQVLKQQDARVDQEVSEATDNNNISNARNQADPVPPSSGSDVGKNEFLSGDERPPQSGMYNPREFYITAGLDETSQAKQVNGTLIPNITSNDKPIISGKTFSDALVEVKVYKAGHIGEEAYLFATQIVQMSESGDWQTSLTNNLPFGDYEAIISAKRGTDEEVKTSLAFKVIATPENPNSDTFTAQFGYEITGNKEDSPTKPGYSIIGSKTEILTGLATPGSLITIVDKGSNPDTSITYTIKVPEDAPADPKNPNSGLVVWSFAFDGHLGKEFADKSDHEISITNTNVIGDVSKPIVKKLTIDASNVNVEVEVSILDTYASTTATSTTPTATGENRGARKSFIDYGDNEDKITANVSELNIKIFVETIFVEKLGEKNGNAKDTLVFEMNGVKLSLYKSNFTVSKTKEGYSEMTINNNSFNLDPSQMKPGIYNYSVTATNKIGATSTASGSLEFDNENKGVETSLTEDSDTAATINKNGEVVVTYQNNEGRNETKALEVSNANQVRFVTSSRSDNITSKKNVEIRFADVVPGDVMRFTLKKSTITEETEAAAESANSSTNPTHEFTTNLVKPVLKVLTEDQKSSLSDEQIELQTAEYKKSYEEALENYNTEYAKQKAAFEQMQKQAEIHTIYFTINKNGDIESVEGKRPLTDEDKERLRYNNGILTYNTVNQLDEGSWESKVESVDKAGNVNTVKQEILIDNSIDPESSKTSEDLSSVQTINGITEANSYVVVTTYDNNGNPIVIDENGIARIVDTVKEASRAVLADANGRWSLTYAANGKKLVPGTYKYQVQIVDVVGNYADLGEKQFQVDQDEDNSRLLDNPYLAKYDKDGKELDKNLIDKKQDAQDLANTHKATGGKADLVFKGEVTDKNGEIDTSINGTSVRFQIWLDDTGINFREFNGTIKNGKWEVQIPKGALDDGLYFYTVKVLTSATSGVEKISSFQLDVKPPFLELNYVDESNHTIGNKFINKTTFKTGSGEDKTENVIALMINNLEGTIKFNTEGFTTGKVIFQLADGKQVTIELSISSTGVGEFKIPQEVKEYLQTTQAATNNGGVGKVAFKFQLTDSANNKADHYGGVFYAPQAVSKLEDPSFTFNTDAPKTVFPNANTGQNDVLTHPGKGELISTSDWGLLDKYYTAHRKPNIGVKVSNIRDYELEFEGRKINTSDGFNGSVDLTNKNNNSTNKYNINGQRDRDSKTGKLQNTGEAIFSSTVTYSTGLTVLRVTPNIKDNFGNEIKPQAESGLPNLNIFNQEISATIQSLDDNDIPTLVNMNVDTTNPKLKFNVILGSEGNILPKNNYNQFWIQISVNSPVDINSQFFRVSDNTSLTVSIKNINNNNDLQSGVHNIYYRIYDAWGNTLDGISSLSVRTSSINLSDDTDSGEKGDDITNVNEPTIIVNTGVGNASQVYIFVGNNTFVAEKQTDDGGVWKVDLKNVRKVVFKNPIDVATATAEEIAANIATISEPQSVKLNDGDYKISALIISGTSSSRAFNNLIIDTSAPLPKLVSYSSTKATFNPILENVYYLFDHKRGINFDITGDFKNDSVSFRIPELNISVDSLTRGSYGSAQWYANVRPSKELFDKYANASKPVTAYLTLVDKAGNSSTTEFTIYLGAVSPRISFGNDVRPQLFEGMSDEDKARVEKEIKDWDDNHIQLKEVGTKLPIIANGSTNTMNLYGLPGHKITFKKDGKVVWSKVFDKTGIIEGVSVELGDYEFEIDYSPITDEQNKPYKLTMKTQVTTENSDDSTLTVELANSDHTGNIEGVKEDKSDTYPATTSRTPDFTGTAPPLSQIKLVINGLEEFTYNVRSDAEGKWTLNIPEDAANKLNPGYHFVNVTSISLLGKIGKSVTSRFFVDVSTPTIQIGFAKNKDSNVESIIITNQKNSQVIKGNLPSNLTKVVITYQFPYKTVSGRETEETKDFVTLTKINGKWTANKEGITVEYDEKTGNFTLSGGDFKDIENKGTISFNVVASTVTGASVKVNLLMKVDTEAPSVPTQLLLSDQIYESASAPNKTTVKQIIIRGKSNDSEGFVELTLKGKTYSGFVQPNGEFSIAINSEDVDVGENKVKVKSIDFAGNSSAEVNYSFTYANNLLTITSYFPDSLDAKDSNNTKINATFAPNTKGGIDFKAFTIKGNVKDAKNQPVKDATVTITIAGLEKTVKTNAAGDYEFNDISPRELGSFNYTITASKDSSASLTRQGTLTNKSRYKLFAGGLAEESDTGAIGDNVTTIKFRSKITLTGEVDDEYQSVKIKIRKFGSTDAYSEITAQIVNGKWIANLSSYNKNVLDIGAYEYQVIGTLKTDANQEKITAITNVQGSFLINNQGAVSLYTNIHDSKVDAAKHTYGENNEKVFLTDPLGKKINGVVTGGAGVIIQIYRIDQQSKEETLINSYTPEVGSNGEFSQSLDSLSAGLYKIVTSTTGKDTEIINKTDNIFVSAVVGGNDQKNNFTIRLTPETDTGPSDNDGKTRNLSPVLTGIATPFAVIAITPANGSKTIYAIADENGVWYAYDIPSIPGTNTVTVTVTDISGKVDNASYSYDILRTNVSINTVSYNGENGGNIIITKTGAGIAMAKASIMSLDGKTVERVVFFDQSKIQPTINKATNTYTFKIPFDLETLNPEGRSVLVEGFVQDEYGNYSEIKSFTIYGFSSEIGNSADESKVFNNVTYLQNDSVTIQGEGKPGQVITVIVKNAAGAQQFTGAGNVDSNGKWTVLVSGLKEGIRYTYVATNPESVQKTGDIEIQKGAPTISNVTFVEMGDTRKGEVNTEDSSAKNYVAYGTAVVTGQLSQQGIVTITISKNKIGEDGKPEKDAEGNIIKIVNKYETATDDKGKWVIAISGLTEQGEYSYSVNATSFSGIKANGGQVHGVIKVIKQEAGEVQTITNKEDGPDDDENDNSYIFKGTVDKESSIIFILIDKSSGSTIFTAQQSANGEFFVKVPKSVLPYGNSEYTYKIYSVGNENGAKEADVNIPSTKFKVSANLLIDESIQNEANKLDATIAKAYSGTATPTLTGYAAPNAKITVTLTKQSVAGSSIGEAPISIETTANELGIWTVTVPADNELSDATYSYTVKQGEATGADTSSQATGTIIVNSNKPVGFMANVVTTLNTYNQKLDATTASTGNATKVNDITPTVFGQVQAGSTAIIGFEGKEYLVYTNADGRFIFNLPTKNNLISGQTYTFTINAINKAGVKGDPVTKEFSVSTNGIDLIAPVVNPMAEHGEATSNYVYNTNNPANLEFKGTVSEASTILVRLKIDDVVVAERATTTENGGNWTIPVNATNLLTPGVQYQFEIQAVDKAGNRAATHTGSFSVAQSTNNIDKSQENTIDNYLPEVDNLDTEL